MIRRLYCATFAVVLTIGPFLGQAGAQPKGEAQVEPLPPAAVARIGTTRFRHASAPTSLAFSSDGKQITSSTIWNDTAVWDAATGQAFTFRSKLHKDRLFRATVSPDGSLIVGRTRDDELAVQEALSGKILHRFSLAGRKEYTEGLVISSDNRRIAATDRDGNIFLWDVETGKLLHQLKSKKWDTFDGFCQALSPDGSVFIQARADDLTIWNVQTGEELRRIVTGHKEQFTSEWSDDAAISPDGLWLAVRIAYGRIDLWEIKTGLHFRSLADKRNTVGPIFSPDGKHVATGEDSGEIHFWEVATGKLAVTLTLPPEQHPTSFAFSPDGKRLAVGCADHAIRCWDWMAEKEIAPIASPLGGEPSVRILADGTTLLAHCKYDRSRYRETIDQRLSLWDLRGKWLQDKKLIQDDAHAYQLTDDAKIVAYADGPHFGIGSRPVQNRFLRSAIRLCDVATGKGIVAVDEVPCQIHDFTFSRDGRFLLVNAFNAGANPEDYDHPETLQLWQRKSPTSLDKVADLRVEYFLSGYGISPDSRYVVVTSKGGGYRFHDCETGKLLRSYPDAKGSVVAISPNGRHLISRDVRDARQADSVPVWEEETGKTICELECEAGQADWTPLVFSPDGRFIAGGLDREIIGLWDVRTGKLVGRLAGHRGDINSLCFSGDGQFLVSASDDTTILIWNWRQMLPSGGSP